MRSRNRGSATARLSRRFEKEYAKKTAVERARMRNRESDGETVKDMT